MRRYSVLLTLICGSLLSRARTLVPRPYTFVGPKQMGAGYAPFAFIGGAGARIDSRRFLLDANAWYDNGRKTDDNDQPNQRVAIVD